MSDGMLVIMPALRASTDGHGRIGLTLKFVDGVEAYAETWDGPIRVLMERTAPNNENLDNVYVEPKSLSFELEVIDYHAPDLESRLRGTSVILGATSYRQNHLSSLCRSLGVPCVYGTENSLRTRVQMARTEERSAWSRFKRSAWEVLQERRQRGALREADGVQCNGLPTYVAYEKLTPNPLLFFDTRTTSGMMITDEELERRLSRLLTRKPLRLAYTGRLIAIKGVEYLLPMADELRRLGVAFDLSLYGGGELDAVLRKGIARLGLEQVVHLKGVVDFKTVLAPLMKQETDLFVSPHIQGDPSCTYLETYSAGVPIVGFSNEAFAGLVERAPGAGFQVPLRNPRAAAAKIAELDRKRELIADASRAAIAFARAHSFEATFKARTDHLRRCVERRGASN